MSVWRNAGFGERPGGSMSWDCWESLRRPGGSMNEPVFLDPREEGNRGDKALDRSSGV